MNLEALIKIAKKAFDNIAQPTDEVSPIDLITEIQSEMKKYAESIDDKDDLTDIENDSNFDWLKV